MVQSGEKRFIVGKSKQWPISCAEKPAVQHKLGYSGVGMLCLIDVLQGMGRINSGRILPSVCISITVCFVSPCALQFRMFIPVYVLCLFIVTMFYATLV